MRDRDFEKIAELFAVLMQPIVRRLLPFPFSFFPFFDQGLHIHKIIGIMCEERHTYSVAYGHGSYRRFESHPFTIVSQNKAVPGSLGIAARHDTHHSSVRHNAGGFRKRVIGF